MTTSPLFILYGSATGNAEHIAKDLAATYQTLLSNPDATTFFSSVICCELDHYKKKCESTWNEPPPEGQVKHGVLVVTSTTGNGDAPENASRFTRFVKRKTSVASQPLKHVAYAVLGLGDTNYDQFCNTGKVLDKKMAELGGTRICPIVCADEATGLEDAVDPWTATILAKITTACRGENADAAVSVTVTTQDSTAQEEKKMEPADEPVTKTTVLAKQPSSTLTSEGVNLVRAWLQENPIESVKLDTVAPKDTLPTVGAPRISSFVLQNEKSATTTEGTKSAESTDDEGDALLYTYHNPYPASLQSARYLTQTTTASGIADGSSVSHAVSTLRKCYPLDGDAAERNGKRVIEITLKVPDEGFAYEPGDAIGMVVENEADHVAWILDLLQQNHGLDASQYISLDDNEPRTVKQIVTQQMDLTWSALHHGHRRVLMALSQQATGDEKVVLEWMSSSQGEALFQKFVVEQRRSVIDLMKEFPSLQTMSLQTMVGILPPIAPRYYSITSSPLVTKNSLGIALAVVDYLTPSLKVAGIEHGCRRIGGLASQYLEGLATSWLSSSSSGATIPIFLKPNFEFRLPTSLQKPIVLIGPGTGVAPFVGFLQHRQVLSRATDVPAGSADLYFGCRHPDHDFLYQNEFETLKEGGTLTRFHTAFSREGANKVYVQDIMKQNSDVVRDLLLRQDASVYICGDGNHMAKAVQAALQSILEEELGDVAATDCLAQMKKDRRLVLDIWS